MNPTPQEIEEMVSLVRILIGDTPSSIFYPVLSNSEIEKVLRLEKWDVMKAARRAAVSVAFVMTTVNYRERSGDIEVWQNASIEYRKVLDNFLDDYSKSSLPSDITAYAAGISWKDVCDSNNNPDKVRSPLARITPCLDWWTRVKNYPCCNNDSIVNWNIRK